jgi:hypothetical protein
MTDKKLFDLVSNPFQHFCAFNFLPASYSTHSKSCRLFISYSIHCTIPYLLHIPWFAPRTTDAQCTVFQLSKEGWKKVFPHLSWASDHQIMQFSTLLKPLFIVGPVCFSLFGHNWGKTMFYNDFEYKHVLKFVFLCFKMNEYWTNYIKSCLN